MTPLTRASVGLEPTRSGRCPARTISQSDFRQVIRSSSHCWLVRPYRLRLNLTDLPCSHHVLRAHADGTNPGSTPKASPLRPSQFRFPFRAIRSATPTTFDFGANIPFTFVSAYALPVYASQRTLPYATQDSVRGCRLSFTAATISGRGTPCASKAQCSPNPACRFPAPGSPVGSCASHTDRQGDSGMSVVGFSDICLRPLHGFRSTCRLVSGEPSSLFTPRRHRACLVRLLHLCM